MKIILIGGVHEFFSCRDELVSVLTELSERMGSPEFVAVEYGEAFYNEHIAPQRSADALKKRPGSYQAAIESVLSRKEMEIGAEYIAYDCVTHKNFFPDVPTVWLDNNRSVEDWHIQVANSMLYNRLSTIAAFKKALPSHTKLSCSALMAALKKTEPGTEKSLPHNPKRELLWLKELEPYLVEDAQKYGIAIVGADHTKDEEGFLHNLLKKYGHKVEVKLTC
ncbi:hypothetical protein ACR42D_15025 [Desulfovibrio caledoniensis]